MKPRHLLAALGLLTAGCAVPTVDVSDFSLRCAVDSDCAVTLEVPCERCTVCQGIAFAKDELKTYNERLASANVFCGLHEHRLSLSSCSPCASDTARETPTCTAGTCVAGPEPGGAGE